MYSLLTNDNHSVGIRIIELFMYEIVQHVHEFTLKGEGSPAINSRWMGFRIMQESWHDFLIHDLILADS